MTPWATAVDFVAWTDLPKIKDSDEGTLTRALRRAQLNIVSVCRQEPATISDNVLEALYIVAERIILGRDQTVMATSARGLSSAQFGDHSITLGAGAGVGATQNPFITPEVLALLDTEINKFGASELGSDKMVIAGDTGYDTEDESDFTYVDYSNPRRGPYPVIP